MQVIDYGGIITAINVKDKDGKVQDIALGYDKLQGWEDDTFYFGALIGRYANRIAGGKFTLDGKTHELFVNSDPNSLHGGKVGFNKKVWKSKVDCNKLVLEYCSPDGEENYPGAVNVKVTYQLDDDNQLTITYQATSDQATPINLTNHTYFNLAGHDQGDIKDHVVTIKADSFLPLNEDTIPTGEIKKVDGTPMDLRKPVRLGDKLEEVEDGKGYDNTFCLDNQGCVCLAARVEHPPSGRFVECYTSEPSVHFYTGHYIENAKGKCNATYGPSSGFCLECQHYPDSVNQECFPDVILRPCQTYYQKTVYKFGVM